MRFSQASRIIQAVKDGCNLTLLGICSSFRDLLRGDQRTQIYGNSQPKESHSRSGRGS